MKLKNLFVGKKLSTILLLIIFGMASLYLADKLFIEGAIKINFDSDRMENENYKSTRHYNKTFEVTRGTELFAKLLSMDVKVVLSKDNKVHIIADAQISSDTIKKIPKDFLTFVNGKYFIINEKELSIFGSKSFNNCKITIEAPKKLFSTINISSENGDIDVEGVSSECSLSTDNGAISCSDVNKLVSADTTNGDVSISNVKGELYADTTNGDVVLKGCSDNVMADTVNGNISADFVKPTIKKIVLASDKGDVNISGLKPQNMSIDLKSRSDSVNISDKFKKKIKQKYDDVIKCKIGRGKNTLKVWSFDGSVNIK